MRVEESATADQPGVAPRTADWWHRDHPTFTALTGFFSGLLFASLVPVVFVVVMDALFEERTTREAFPFVLLALVVPTLLVISSRTRRFGTYMWIGIAVAAAIIGGVGAFVLIMLNRTTL